MDNKEGLDRSICAQICYMLRLEYNKIRPISCNEPQGKLTGYIFRYILDEQRNIDESGI